jgi:hypothetical protein
MTPRELISDWLEENATTVDGGEWSILEDMQMNSIGIRLHVRGQTHELDRFQERYISSYMLNAMFDLKPEEPMEHEHEIVRFMLLFGPTRILGLSEQGKRILASITREMLHGYVDFKIRHHVPSPK